MKTSRAGTSSNVVGCKHNPQPPQAGTPRNISRVYGYTFLEIVVVLFLVGLLLLLIYPRMQVLTEDGLRTASRRLIGMTAHLYHEAVATRKVHRLSFDLQSGQYRVSVVNFNGELQNPGPLRPSGDSLPHGVIFQDVVTLQHGKVTEGEAFTHFFPVGLVDQTVIHLRDQDQRSLTLEVNPLTGKVKVYEGYVEIKKVGNNGL